MMDVEQRCEYIDRCLPWFINRSLPRKEAEHVRAHLDQCTRCRGEAEWLGRLGSQLQGMHRSVPKEPSFTELRRRIADDIPARYRTNFGNPWFALAAGLLLALAVTLGVMLAWQPFQPRYQTVTDPVSPASNIVLLELELEPDTPLSSLYDILERHDATVVSGPGEKGQVRLEFPLDSDETAESLLKDLEKHPRVSRVKRPGDNE